MIHDYVLDSFRRGVYAFEGVPQADIDGITFTFGIQHLGVNFERGQTKREDIPPSRRQYFLSLDHWWPSWQGTRLAGTASVREAQALRDQMGVPAPPIMPIQSKKGNTKGKRSGKGKGKGKVTGKSKGGKESSSTVPPWRTQTPPPPMRDVPQPPPPPRASRSSASSATTWQADEPPRAKSRTMSGSQSTWKSTAWTTGGFWAGWNWRGVDGFVVETITASDATPQIIWDWLFEMGLTSFLVQLLAILLFVIFDCGYRILCHSEPDVAYLRSMEPLPQPVPEPEESSSAPSSALASRTAVDIAPLPDVAVTLEADTELSYYTAPKGRKGHLSRHCASAGGSLPVALRSINYGARQIINWCPNCSRLMINDYGPRVSVKAPPATRP